VFGLGKEKRRQPVTFFFGRCTDKAGRGRTRAWDVGFFDGLGADAIKTGTSYVRALRSGL
jgi:hypothetical protein